MSSPMLPPALPRAAASRRLARLAPPHALAYSPAARKTTRSLRSALLKSARAAGRSDPAGLDVWDDQLVAHGTELTAGRLRLTGALRPLIAARGGHVEDGVVRIPDGPVLKLGIEHEQVALLRKRLEVPAADGAKETVFDAEVEQAVKRDAGTDNRLSRSVEAVEDGDGHFPPPHIGAGRIRGGRELEAAYEKVGAGANAVSQRDLDGAANQISPR